MAGLVPGTPQANAATVGCEMDNGVRNRSFFPKGSFATPFCFVNFIPF